MKLTSFQHTADKPAFVEAFSQLPARIRRGAYRNALLPIQLERILVDLPSPAPRNSWLVEHGGRPIGRIAANISSHPQTGYVGFFEVDTRQARAAAAARLLIDAACNFLQDRAVRVFGPVNLNTWLPYRFRIDARDERCFAWEPVDPPEYVEHFLAAGFKRSADYHSTAFANLERFLEQTEPEYQAALAKGFRFRRLDWSRLHQGDGTALYNLTNAAFEGSFLFETAPQPLFDLFLGTQGKPKNDCTHFAASPKGDDVGFFFAFTDLHSPSTGASPETYVVLKTTGVTKEARGRGLSNALAHLAVKSALAMGAQYGIAALVRAGLQSESYAKKGDALWQHNYALFEKRLSQG